MSALRKYDDERYFAANDNLKNSTALKSLKKFLKDESGFFNLPAGLGLPFVPAAGGTTYVNSVQHVSITIPTGSSSATATITAVGANAFILFNGFQCTASGNAATSYPRVELTNSTTITAFRNSSSATDTVTVKVVVVDATSSLIASVQFGTISLGSASSSGTATVSSTNASFTAVHILGFTNASTALTFNAMECRVTISGTTVTANRQFSGSAQTVGFVVIEFQSAACNQAVQKITKSWTSTSATSTQTITSVNTSNTIIIYAGSDGNSASNGALAEQYADLTNSTTVTFHVNTSASVALHYTCFVVEFATGVLNSNVQRGTTTLTGASSNTATITSVDTTKAIVNSLRNTVTTTTAVLPQDAANAVLTNGTTVTVARNSSTNNVTGSWEVAEFV